MVSWSIAFWEENTDECRRLLGSGSAWESIPLLDRTRRPEEIVDEQLVRFRGMIQDMYNPELYLSRYEVVDRGTGCSSVRSGKYRESVAWEASEEFIQDSSCNVHSERQTFYCVPVPGVNSWVISSEQEKREANRSECGDAPSAAKRLCVDASTVSRSSEKSTDLDFPLQTQRGTACLVKVYDGEKLSLNDVIEVIGFLAVNEDDVSPPKDGGGTQAEDKDIVDQDVVPPGVPRLHCVAFRKLSHCNPLLPSASEQESVFESAESVRQEVHMVLSHVLCGDTLAADYLLCHLLSSVYLRSNLMALGKMSLNVTNVPAECDYANKLYNVLTLLLPKSHFLPMTLDNLNKQMFVPKKDYTVNKLKSGVLQLSRHTHLVLDETQLMPGQLDATGVQNVTALGMVMRHQKLDYDFKYYSLEFETDIPVLVLSEGKSLLPSDVVVPLSVDNSHIAETFEAARHYLKEPLLGKIRVYLTTMMGADFTVPPSMQQVIEQDFVNLRKEDSKFTPDDLHKLLVLARLVSLSKGSRELSETSWKYAIEMECKRKQRL